MICKIEWHAGELFPRIGFIVTNSRLGANKVVQVYNGRAEIENRIQEGTLEGSGCIIFKTGVPSYPIVPVFS